MPRVKQYGPDYKLVARRIKAECVLAGREIGNLQEASGLSRTTFFTRMRHPENLTLEEMVHITTVLHISLEELLKGVTTQSCQTS